MMHVHVHVSKFCDDEQALTATVAAEPLPPVEPGGGGGVGASSMNGDIGKEFITMNGDISITTPARRGATRPPRGTGSSAPPPPRPPATGAHRRRRAARMRRARTRRVLSSQRRSRRRARHPRRLGQRALDRDVGAARDAEVGGEALDRRGGVRRPAALVRADGVRAARQPEPQGLVVVQGVGYARRQCFLIMREDGRGVEARAAVARR